MTVRERPARRATAPEEGHLEVRVFMQQSCELSPGISRGAKDGNTCRGTLVICVSMQKMGKNVTSSERLASAGTVSAAD